MRGSHRYGKNQQRRGLFSGSRQASLARVRCKCLSAALLLLIGVPWLTSRPPESRIDESTKRTSLNETNASWKTEVFELQKSEQSAEDRGADSNTSPEKLPPKITINESERDKNQNSRQATEVNPDPEKTDENPIENVNENSTDGEMHRPSSIHYVDQATLGEQLDEDDVCNRTKYLTTEQLNPDKITILINGFSESRLPLLQRNVQMYSTMSLVHAIYILWGNTSTPAKVLDEWTFDSYGAPIFIVRQDSSSLNDRFLPRTYIETSSVIICDDDITVEPNSLKFAMDVWREDEGKSIVGFFPRVHMYDHESKSWMYVKQQRKYSIMLTKLMVLATEYLYLYTCEMPSGVKEYVDEGNNCEDIAMNFLVSNRSGRGPILVEGKPRDWGDPRNSGFSLGEDELSTRVDGDRADDGALSGRTGHRKHRGDCITKFEKLWKGMALQFSYTKASQDLENEVQCEKFGYLVDCDSSVISKRDVRRMLGENLISPPTRFAYVTFISSDLHLNASILLVQSLRTSGTIHDFVLMLGPSCSTIAKTHVLYDHFDKLVRVNVSQHGKLRVWMLLDYAKVVYIEVDSLVLANLDHLFQLPEPSAAPSLFMPGEFSTGLLVLKPCNETYAQLVQFLETMQAGQSSSSTKKWMRHYLLNSYFSGWYQMPAENRLPARYNVPVSFSKKLEVPSWFDLTRAYDTFGPLMVIRYGNVRLDLVQSSDWSSARLRLFESLLKNDLRPLESDNISHWAPITRNPSLQEHDSTWPPRPHGSLAVLSVFTSEKLKSREAFVTILFGSQISSLSVAGWGESFHHYHSFQSRPKALLLVLSTLDEAQYQEYSGYFDEVRVVDPIVLKGRISPSKFSLVHLWNQTDYDKLVYIDAASLFVQNCNSLLDYAPFAAVPRLFPPDTFSTNVMSIEPNEKTFELLMQKLLSFESDTKPVDRFLNDFYSDWYQKPIMHRISPSFGINMVFESHVRSFALPWKILSFDLEWLPDKEANVTSMRTQTVCGLKPAKLPHVIMALCGAKEGEAA